ncbi:hypothetical protein HYALB_00009480 [Hymenoscyphus albidus]|uniref:Uncharacterized protein n=1 Tax=Hymenoscyphus albidus TaxID=595503 RepID=A0A9N9QBS8_9HELO|nr:hypothetical protein HYALB_00009480 [Hymenoscyphus albidus]
MRIATLQLLLAALAMLSGIAYASEDLPECATADDCYGCNSLGERRCWSEWELWLCMILDMYQQSYSVPILERRYKNAGRSCQVTYKPNR